MGKFLQIHAKGMIKMIFVLFLFQCFFVSESNAYSTSEVMLAEEDVTIRGIVRDSNGEPLPGATITVQGSTIGTVSDLDGRYTIEVPEGAIFRVSYIGYETQRIEIGNRTTIDITLVEDAASMDEVVTIGYGTQQPVPKLIPNCFFYP